MRVLLIEDDRVVRHSIALLLRADAMCVDTAHCGERTNSADMAKLMKMVPKADRDAMAHYLAGL